MSLGSIIPSIQQITRVLVTAQIQKATRQQCGPSEPIVFLNGMTWGTYKWQKINGVCLGLFHPAIIGVTTYLIYNWIVGAHLEEGFLNVIKQWHRIHGSLNIQKTHRSY